MRGIRLVGRRGDQRRGRNANLPDHAEGVVHAGESLDLRQIGLRLAESRKERGQRIGLPSRQRGKQTVHAVCRGNGGRHRIRDHPQQPIIIGRERRLEPREVQERTQDCTNAIDVAASGLPETGRRLSHPSPPIAY